MPKSASHAVCARWDPSYGQMPWPDVPCVTALVCLVAWSGVTAGPQGDTAAMRVAQRHARVDAQAGLFTRVGQLRISGNITVDDILGEDDRVASMLRTALHEAAAFSRPRVYTDGTVEVDARITLRWVMTTLQALHAEHYRGTGVKATDLIRPMQDGTQRFIFATGSADPAALPDPGDAAADASVTPAGWENVTTQGMVMARRAAEFEARRRLYLHITGLRLSSGTTLGQRMANDERLSARLQTLIDKSAAGKPQYDPDAVCMVKAELMTDILIAAFESLRSPGNQAQPLEPADLEGLRRTIDAASISAVGRAVAPPVHVITPDRTSAGPPPPAWARHILRTSGTANTGSTSSGTPEARYITEATAIAEAHRKLAEELDAVEIAPGKTVATLIDADERFQADVATFLEGVRKVSVTSRDDGATMVTLELPLERLWRILRDHDKGGLP